MLLKVTYEHHADHVLVIPVGDPDIEQFLAMLHKLGTDSAAWPQGAVIVDLRGVTRDYGFTDQFRIGETIGRHLSHLRRNAAVVQPERITRVGEKAANHTGATVRVFADMEEARAWVRS